MKGKTLLPGYRGLPVSAMPYSPLSFRKRNKDRHFVEGVSCRPRLFAMFCIARAMKEEQKMLAYVRPLLRLFILFALVLTAVFVAKPTRASAYQDCCQT